MADNLDVIILDDDAGVCDVLSEIVTEFHSWGKVYAFTDENRAIEHCLNRKGNVAIFIVDVFLSGRNAFSFLESIADKFPMAYEDTIIITGKASGDVVNMCLVAGINYLLEKPVRPFALQLAVRAIVSKYVHFARKLYLNPDLMESVAKFTS